MLQRTLLRFVPSVSSSDVQRFCLPLAKRCATSTDVVGHDANHQRTGASVLRYECPFCFAAGAASGEVELPQRVDATAMDRHVLFHHQAPDQLGTSQAIFEAYNRKTVAAAVASSYNTDATLVVDLANIELRFSKSEVVALCRSTVLRSLFARIPLTCLITHELMIPFDAAISAAFAQLVALNPHSALLTQFASDGLDKGDLLSAAAIQELLTAPGSDARILLLTSDWGQRTSLQLLYDTNRVRCVALPKSPHLWPSILEEQIVRE